MSPPDLLEYEFFNTYIKTGIFFPVRACLGQLLIGFLGNILMISEGRAGSDNVFTLQDG